MTSATLQQNFSQQQFEAFLSTRREPDWLLERRRKAWQTFCQFAWPKRNEEEWMRTDIRLFKLDRFSLPLTAPTQTVPSTPLLAQGVELGGSSASLDSHSIRVELAPKWQKKGVVFGSLDKIVAENGDLVRKHLLTRAVDPARDKFAALHAACWSGGHVLYVPRGVVVDEPLHVLSAMSDGAIDLGHLLVVLEEGAEATVLSETASHDPQDGGLHCGAIELIQGPGSHLRFVSLQNWGQGVWHFGHAGAVVDRDATLQWTMGAIGSRLSKVNQHVALVGPGASCQVNGILFAEGKQHLSFHTLQHHQAPSCRSDFLYKAALQDRARTVWRGVIKVDPDAQKTDGYQRNDNLLLSSQARADSIPGLEIQADDVRCTHGSTSGRVDEELIFYARCRGLSRREAIRLVVSGFFQQVIDRITIESVREALGHAIGRRVREYD